VTARKVEKLLPFQQYSKPKVFKTIFKESKDRREIKIEGGGEKWTNNSFSKMMKSGFFSSILPIFDCSIIQEKHSITVGVG